MRHFTNLPTKSLQNNFFSVMLAKVCNNMSLKVEAELKWEILKIF